MKETMAFYKAHSLSFFVGKMKLSRYYRAMMECRVKKVEEQDIPTIVELFDRAKVYFAEKEIPQWKIGGYPEEIDVKVDMNLGYANVLLDQNEIVGYCAIACMVDPTYQIIEGNWLNEESYVVMHRTCIADYCKGKGYAGQFVQEAMRIAKQNGIHNIRCDTHEKNLSMRRMLEKNGFVYCGVIYVEDGTPRVAYQLQF